MKILGNSTRGLNHNQKGLLYKSYALPIALYRFQLWYFHRAPLLYPLKIPGKLQRRAAIWILVAFKTSPSLGIEAITGLMPINLHLQKLSGRSQLCAPSLLPNYILYSLIEAKPNITLPYHLLLLDSLTK